MSSNQPPATEILDSVVIGAGFAGLYMLYRLRALGFSVRGIEAGDDVGGTWYWNRYPGARCDVESRQYSYSFSEELQQDWRWPDKYAVQPDILNYINHVADRFDLRRDISFNMRVTSARFDDATALWTVETDAGQTFRARFVVMAAGNLTLPSVPPFPGLENFRGQWFHAARWDDSADFRGKRVALIGTGATGVQLVPKIAAQAEHLHVMQRTPNFSVPARNGPVSDDADLAYKAEYPAKRQQALSTSFGMSGIDLPACSAMDVSEEERDRLYEKRWQEGGSINFLSTFNDLLINEASNETAAEFVRRKIRATVKDPDVAKLLCPVDHPIGSKRLCVDTDYYETYNRSNVTLVDVRSDPIETITPDGIKTLHAHYAVDAIVFATGFDAITGALLSIDVTGRGGHTLRRKWAEGPATYLGLMTAGFPNMFIVTGPGSPSVKSNMVQSIEQHVDMIAQSMDYMRSNGFTTMEADVRAEQAWVAHVNEVADRTLYTHADSWYLGSNIPGKPRVFMPYVGGVPAYRAKCDEVVESGYAGFSMDVDQPADDLTVATNN
ncbi:MAG: flavin-containing monooxygenase [Sphingobium sp.]